MAMPDIGLAPPPPVDVSAQMKPSGPPGAPSGGGPDLGALIAGLTGGSAPSLNPDLTPQIMEVNPILDQLARQVPAMGPDVDRLEVELKSRMAGLPMQMGIMGGMPGAPSPGMPPGAGAPPPPAPLGAGGIPSPMPPAPPVPTGTMGAMDTAMQLEIKLPAIGKSDPTLMPYIQGFIARMREEVPKVVQGDTEAVAPPPQASPTEAMLSKMPVTY